MEATALREGLSEGRLERNTEILFRYADYRFDRLPELAGGTRAPWRQRHRLKGRAIACRQGDTSTIPVVFESAVDPIANGLVANLNRPGGNVPGVTLAAEASNELHTGLEAGPAG